MRFQIETWSPPEVEGDWLWIAVRGTSTPYHRATRWSPAEGGELEDVEVREIEPAGGAWLDLQDWAESRRLSEREVAGLYDRIADALKEDPYDRL